MAEDSDARETLSPEPAEEVILTERAEHGFDTGTFNLETAKRISGQSAVSHEVEPLFEAESETEEIRRLARPRTEPAKFRQRPPARGWRARAARDTRSDLKPFPYGTRED